LGVGVGFLSASCSQEKPVLFLGGGGSFLVFIGRLRVKGGDFFSFVG
jgi:hypothetical protein